MLGWHEFPTTGGDIDDQRDDGEKMGCSKFEDIPVYSTYSIHKSIALTKGIVVFGPPSPATCNCI
jgi:hypothetical protein